MLQLLRTLLLEPGRLQWSREWCSGALGEPGKEAPQPRPPSPPLCAECSCTALPFTLEPKSPVRMAGQRTAVLHHGERVICNWT